MTTRTRAQAHAPNAQNSRASVKLMKFPQPQSSPAARMMSWLWSGISRIVNPASVPKMLIRASWQTQATQRTTSHAALMSNP
jgi:hypothetical protein